MWKQIKDRLVLMVWSIYRIFPTETDTGQGGNLSPLLINIYLDKIDKELERWGHKIVQSADGCNIYVKSKKVRYRVMESVTKFLKKRTQANRQSIEKQSRKSDQAKVSRVLPTWRNKKENWEETMTGNETKSWSLRILKKEFIKISKQTTRMLG